MEMLARAKKANLDLKNLGGFAPLHLACQNGHNQSCRELLLAQADPDVRNNVSQSDVLAMEEVIAEVRNRNT